MKSSDIQDAQSRAQGFAGQPDFGWRSTTGGEAVEVDAGRANFEAAVTEFASWIHLDPAGMLRGETFEVSGVPVTFAHYGAGDPDGATIIVDYGPFSPEAEATVLRTLLEHNLVTPAARQGYFAVGPGASRILYCIRVGVEDGKESANAIGRKLGMAVETIRAMSFAIVRQLDAIKGNAGAGHAQVL